MTQLPVTGLRFWVLVLLLALTTTTCLAEIRPYYLRCEYRQDAFIDVQKPRLSWLLEAKGRGQRQIAYQVLVATKAGLLMQDKGNLWDSGKVESDATCQIEYAGQELASRQRCY